MDNPGPSSRKPRSYAAPVQEDAKYQAKYKDLKRKVREVEGENDKLQFKVLQAKRSIQRMKLERSILYERLSTIPSSPKTHDNLAPPVHSGPGIPPPYHEQPQQRPAVPHHPMHPAESEDHGLIDYLRRPPNMPVRAYPAAEMVGPGVMGIPTHSPHLSARRTSAGHESTGARLPPISSLHTFDGSRAPQSQSRSSPRPRQSIHEQQPHHSSRSDSRYPPYYPPPSQQQQPERQHSSHYSPELNILSTAAHLVSPTSERDMRPRRHEHESSRGEDVHQPARHSQQASPPHSSRNNDPSSRNNDPSPRIHQHQRVGPGAHLAQPEERGGAEYEQQHQRARPTRPGEYQDGAHAHYLDVPTNTSHLLSRTASAVDRDEHRYPDRDSRKRNRNDMELVDRGETDGGIGRGARSRREPSNGPDERGSKRFHQQQQRGGREDSQDEGDA